MKRVQMFLAGAFIAVGSLYAQTPASEWKAGVAKLKETIQANPAQAAEEAEQMIKGKNKKNIELLVAIGEAYLEAGKIPEAQQYAALAKKANGKSADGPYWREILPSNRRMPVLLLKNMRKPFTLIRAVRRLI